MHQPGSAPDSRSRRITYLLAGAAWILLSDLVLYTFVHDGPSVSRLETAKGWMFAAVSAPPSLPITSRILARLERSEATMRAGWTASPTACCWSGLDGKIVDVNPAAAACWVSRTARHCWAWTPRSSRAGSGSVTPTGAWSRPNG
jgi:hypothetical protein